MRKNRPLSDILISAARTLEPFGFGTFFCRISRARFINFLIPCRVLDENKKLFR